MKIENTILLKTFDVALHANLKWMDACSHSLDDVDFKLIMSNILYLVTSRQPPRQHTLRGFPAMNVGDVLLSCL